MRGAPDAKALSSCPARTSATRASQTQLHNVAVDLDDLEIATISLKHATQFFQFVTNALFHGAASLSVLVVFQNEPRMVS